MRLLQAPQLPARNSADVSLNSCYVVPETLKPLFSPLAEESGEVVETQALATAAAQQAGTEAAQSSSSCTGRSQLEDAMMDPFKKAFDSIETKESKREGVWTSNLTPIGCTPRTEFMSDVDFLEQLSQRLHHVEQIVNATGEGQCCSSAKNTPGFPADFETHVERQRQALANMEERLCSLRDEIATCMHELGKAATLQLDLWRECTSEVMALVNSALDQRLGSPGGFEERLETLQKDTVYQRILLENLERLLGNSRKGQTSSNKVLDPAKLVHSELSKHFVKASPVRSSPASIHPSMNARVVDNMEHGVAPPASKQESCQSAANGSQRTVARSTSPQLVTTDATRAQASDARAAPPRLRGRSPRWLRSNVQRSVPPRLQHSLSSVAECELQQPITEQQQQQQQQQWQLFGQAQKHRQITI